ncbi:monoglyceride lipase [Elysia marginata]|uniref:Monoglyceride lipase n=1 Tax=Elysia marginata TaxID=1093978 RepID=A0AAV4HEI7_9GAST|nr:monoglyceride lipase [Elysia marginata]
MYPTWSSNRLDCAKRCLSFLYILTWAVCLNDARKEIESKLSTIEWPFLTIHGEEDAIVNPQASQALHDKAASSDKTITIYPGAYHQLHRDIEPDGSTARQQLLDWLVGQEQTRLSQKHLQ